MRDTRIPAGYEVRRATPNDIALLQDVERTAALLFKTYPGEAGLTEEIYREANSVETFENAQRAGRLWVAVTPTSEVVGFALVMEIAGFAHLEEIDVLPSHGQQGLGSALLSAVCSWAQTAGYPAVTLRTFRDVPWNGPFYLRRGFRVVNSSDVSKHHLDLEASERKRGLRTELRVTMAYPTERMQP
ncbi:MAG TPA: GNAT family N-acetyltransferase [Nitrospiraceae bacterium]|nr:GNAT family N-acetyltransferase [Nitrospiraceae bacterium]